VRIGYAKLGRAWNMDPASWSSVGGDVDVYRLLQRLATRRDTDQFVLVGRNSGHAPAMVGFPSNVVNPYAEDPEMWRQMKAVGKLDPRGGVANWKDDGSLTDIVTMSTGLIWPWFRDLDHIIIWLGQHGTSCQPITPVGEEPPALTQPQTSSICYGGYLINALNHWQRNRSDDREAIWLCPDPRNYLKARDVESPLLKPILGQFDWWRDGKYFQFDGCEPIYGGLGRWDLINGTQHSWVSPTQYVYSGLELTALDTDRALNTSMYELRRHEERTSFGMIINENAPEGANPRLDVMKEWVLPWCPDVELFGKWRLDSVRSMGRDRIDSAPVTQVYDTMSRWRCTFTTPASSSGWATSKPWEAFASDTVCFFHPGYDTQDHILGDNVELKQWLRTDSPGQLERRVRHLDANPQDWAWLVNEQRAHLLRALKEDKIGAMINDRLR
jgi:hypothetical protein